MKHLQLEQVIAEFTLQLQYRAQAAVCSCNTTIFGLIDILLITYILACVGDACAIASGDIAEYKTWQTFFQSFFDLNGLRWLPNVFDVSCCVCIAGVVDVTDLHIHWIILQLHWT